jgi:cytochrome c biogenesis protein CcmG/thiol:disulfide interchange protein DsbE
MFGGVPEEAIPPMTRYTTMFLLLLALQLSACGEEQKQPVNGEPAPTFTLERLEGGTTQFPADYKGRVVAIRFWADWCPFCEGEMRLLEPVYQKYREQGLTILALNVRQDRDTAERFIKELNISYDTLLDIEGEVARSYGVSGLPTTFFVDGNGILQRRIIGESTPETFEQIILEIMQSSRQQQ